jgi:hypothetical protein
VKKRKRGGPGRERERGRGREGKRSREREMDREREMVLKWSQPVSYKADILVVLRFSFVKMEAVIDTETLTGEADQHAGNPGVLSSVLGKFQRHGPFEFQLFHAGSGIWKRPLIDVTGAAPRKQAALSHHQCMHVTGIPPKRRQFRSCTM